MDVKEYSITMTVITPLGTFVTTLDRDTEKEVEKREDVKYLSDNFADFDHFMFVLDNHEVVVLGREVIKRSLLIFENVDGD